MRDHATETTTVMICPRCGATMNHHADKLVDASRAEDAAAVDPALGGMIDEMFGCPRCGNAESRRAPVRARA